MKMIAKCDACGNTTEHSHLHDTAHGIAETHMAGSERFVCSTCGHVVYSGRTGCERFTFVLDTHRTQTKEVE